MSADLRQINTVAGQIIIRRYEERDIPFHEAYIYDSPPEFLEEIGFDTVNRRPRNEFAEWMTARISETAGTCRPNSLVAELEHRPIAIVPLDVREYSDRLPRLHFHIFEAGLRGQGLGGLILMACAEELSRLAGFNKFIIEPRASNERMNRLMRKLGFRHLKDYLAPARPAVQEMIVSQYEISLQKE